MRVTALLFNPPGRGEMLRKHFDMPDSAMPATPADFAIRSVRAVKFFWPQAPTGKAIELQVCDQCNRVTGPSWEVEWALDQHIEEIESFVTKRLAQCESLGDLLKAAASVQPTRRVQL